MAKNRVIVLSIIDSGLRPAEVARRYGVSRRWVQILLARYREGGLDALDPGSRRPHHSPHATPAHVLARIVELRHELSTTGQDAGAMTISMRLEREGLPCPSRATIHRILSDHALVTPQPRKRPRSSWHMFAADQPNQMWQADFTHWPLADGTDTEILNFLDDHSRLLLTTRALTPVTGPLVTATFLDLTNTYGAPAAMLTDNGMVFTTRFAQGRRTIKTLNSFERTLQDHGVRQLNGAPNHPQTQGKIERFHQTLKRWLSAQPPAPDIPALQSQLHTFHTWYNTARPHRALNRQTPTEAYAATPKAAPTPHSAPVDTPCAPTASTNTARSPCATPARCATSASDEPTTAAPSDSSSTTTTSSSPTSRPTPPWPSSPSTSPAATRKRNRTPEKTRALPREPCPETPANDVPRLHKRGARGIRTPDLFHAMEARYQLRHSPESGDPRGPDTG